VTRIWWSEHAEATKTSVQTVSARHGLECQWTFGRFLCRCEPLTDPELFFMQDHSKPNVSLNSESGGTDRRSMPRFNYLIPAEALLIDEAAGCVVSHVQVHVRDVSRSGARLLSAFPWEPGALIAVSWVCPSGDRILKICRIRNHRLGNNGRSPAASVIEAP